MNMLNDSIHTAQIPLIPFGDPDMKLFPELNTPVLIVVKTDSVPLDLIEKYRGFLSKEETAKSWRFRFDRDRVSYILVHGLLRWMLGRHFGISPQVVEITYNSFGRPSVSGYSRQVFFNLSHSSGVSALAFDPENEIGVDVERIDDEFDFEPIAQMFFSKKEKQYIQHSKENSRNRFYQLWTRKEALLKAVGIGISENLHVEVLKEIIKWKTVSENESGHKEFLFRSMLFEQNYRITLAMNAESETPHGYVIGINEKGLPINET
jgi:4'-phosphopantetheinyl transferase